MVTNGDKGGRGVKNRNFYGDILFEWPPTGLEIQIIIYDMLRLEHNEYDESNENSEVRIKTEKVTQTINTDNTKIQNQ